MKKLIIAIDGVAASGKSTTARALARKLDLLSIDTGALYRALALKALREGIPLKNREKLGEMARRTRLDQEMKGVDVRTYLDDQDVSEEIRRKEVSETVPHISKYPEVRSALVSVQRRLAREGGAVVEGRDIGTVVFPDADLKVFMTASPEVRAERRRKELESMGVDLEHDEVQKELGNRDREDSERDVSPLARAEDAFVVDTSDLSIDDQVETILREIERRFGEIPG
jgi:cytidylate kinase